MIDIRSHGAAPGADPAVNGMAIDATLTECRAKKQPLYVPNGVFDTDHPHFFGTQYKASVPVVGDGGGIIRRSRLWAPIVNGQGRHLAIWDKCAGSIVKGVSFDGNSAAYPNTDPAKVMVGDTVRVQYVVTGQVDHESMHTVNNVGLTTTSTATLPETFAAQYLRTTAPILRTKCWAVQQDGGRGATGVVSHWCTDYTERDGIVYGFNRGQGYGTFGGGAAAKVTYLNSHTFGCNHGFNLEAGQGGLGQVVIGDPLNEALRCSSNNDHMGLVSNGNYNARVGHISVEALDLNNAFDAVAMTGLAPNRFDLQRTAIVDPAGSAIRFLTAAAANANALWIARSTLHNGKGISPIVKGGSLASGHGTLALV